MIYCTNDFLSDYMGESIYAKNVFAPLMGLMILLVMTGLLQKQKSAAAPFIECLKKGLE